MHQAGNFWKSIIWTGVILSLCLMPGKDVPQIPIWNFDKLVHAGMFFVMTFVLSNDLAGLRRHLSARRRAIAAGVVYSAILGGAIELMQRYIFLSRTGDWIDFTADIAGALLAAAVAARLRLPLGRPAGQQIP